MKKKALALVWAFILILPCFLMFDGGKDAPIHETLGLTNMFGVVWMAFLTFGGFKLLTPKWMRDYLVKFLEEPENDDALPL